MSQVHVESWTSLVNVLNVWVPQQLVLQTHTEDLPTTFTRRTRLADTPGSSVGLRCVS